MSFDELLGAVAQRQQHVVSHQQRLANAADMMYNDFFAEQRAFYDDPSKLKSLLCPRQSGKTYTDDAGILIHLLRKPNQRALVVCLTLKQCREAHWLTLKDLYSKYLAPEGVACEFHETELRFTLPNGSRCVLVGAETRDKIERLRGPQDDIIVLDEPGSFAPEILEYLIFDILLPRLISRDGELWITGTPGLFARGPFYQATAPHDPKNYSASGKPTCVRFNPATAREVEGSWSFHTWTLKQNVKTKGWQRALINKELRQWTDDNPTWRREYLAEWVADIDGLVYAWSAVRHLGRVTWEPDFKNGDARGLPKTGDWHFVLGMDFGLVDESAFVVLAYSQALGESRVVYEYKAPDMLPRDVAVKIKEIQELFPIDQMVGDHGGLGGKTYLTELEREYGLHIEHAPKHDKNDFIALLNSDFHAGKVKLRPDGDLAKELSELCWDFSDGVDSSVLGKLSRKNKLRENPDCPNHLADALLYVWRFSLHRWKITEDLGPVPGSPEHDRLMDTYAAARAVLRRQRRLNEQAGENDFFGEDLWISDHS